VRTSFFTIVVMLVACTNEESTTLAPREVEHATPEGHASASAPDAPLDASATDATVTDAGAADATEPVVHSHFECKKLGENAYRPYYVQVTASADGSAIIKDWSTTAKGLLGQNAMTSQAECDQARAAANDVFGVICSRTGLDGWKPTIYTGTIPGRADFGYLGGSSITTFGDCLKATQSSSSAGVCFWGGSDWYVSPIDKEGVSKGPFATLDACVAQTKL
jgi:hypothetical protein